MAPSSALSIDGLLTKARALVPFLPPKPKPISPFPSRDQDASHLCSRLPPELRRMIWAAYFGQHAVHMYISRPRLRAKECFEMDADGDFPLGRHAACSHENVQCDHLPLLLTCKKIYFECIRRLYSETLFDFSNGPRALPLMFTRVPANQVTHVSKVNLSLWFPQPLYLKAKNPSSRAMLWVDIWDALAALDGLEWLRFEIRDVPSHQATEWTHLETTLWESIKKVTRPSHFELILPFPAHPSTQAEMLPCIIVRRVGSHESH